MEALTNGITNDAYIEITSHLELLII